MADLFDRLDSERQSPAPSATGDLFDKLDAETSAAAKPAMDKIMAAPIPKSVEEARARDNVAEPEDSWIDTAGKFFSRIFPTFKKQAGGFAQDTHAQGFRQASTLTEGQAIAGMFSPKLAQEFETTRAQAADAYTKAIKDKSLYGSRIAQEAQRDLDANAYRPGDSTLKKYVPMVAESVVQMVPAVAAAFATRNPSAASAVMGAQVYGSQFAESMADGRSPEQAMGDSAFMAAAESIGESIPVGMLMKPGGKFLGRTLKAMGAEGLQEMFTQVLQTGYDKALLTPEMTWGDALAQVRDAGLVGAFTGGTLSVGVDATRATVDAIGKRTTPGVRETAAAVAAQPTPDDVASPLPTDAISAGKAEIAKATASSDADAILAQAGMPGTGKRVSITMPDGSSKAGVVDDAFSTDAGEMGTASGIKVKLDDGTTFAEHFDLLTDAGVKISEAGPLGEADLIDKVLAEQAAAPLPQTDVVESGLPTAEEPAGIPTPAGSTPTRPVSDAKAITESLYPGVVVTSWDREKDDPLSKANPNSWHAKSKAAVDVRPIKGKTFEQFVQGYRDAGYNVIEAIDEVKNPSKHATGPHWHIVLGEGGATSEQAAPSSAAPVDQATAREPDTEIVKGTVEKPDIRAAVADVTGKPIDEEWAQFAPDSGSLGIPRADMPQIKAEHRGAMVNFLNARDIAHEEVTVPATALKPTQAEFSLAKVEKAAGYEGGDRAILISQDGHVLDGHHQWLAKRAAGEDVRAIRLDAPIKDLLDAAHQFPSSFTEDKSGEANQTDDGATEPTTGRAVSYPEPSAPSPPPPTAPAAASPTVTDMPSGKSVLIKGATPEQLAAVRAALPEKVLPLENAKAGGVVYSKKHEAKIRAALAANSISSPQREKLSPAEIDRVENMVIDIPIERYNDFLNELRPPAPRNKSASTSRAAQAGRFIEDMGADAVAKVAAKYTSNPSGTFKPVDLPGDKAPRSSEGRNGAPWEPNVGAGLSRSDVFGIMRNNDAATPVEDLQGNDTGWQMVRLNNGDGAVLVHSTRDEAREFTGKGWRQYAPAWAMDNMDEATSPRTPSAASPTTGAEGAEAPKTADYGAKNKLVSTDRAAELRARLKAKLSGSQLNSGVDPEVLAIGAELAVFHIEAGARRFTDFAKAIATDLDMTARDLSRYLRSWYNGARDMMEDMGESVVGMDTPEEVATAMRTLDTWADVTTGAKPAMEAGNGDQDALSARDAGPGTSDVQRASPQRSDGQPSGSEGQGSAPAIRAADSGRGSGTERGSARPVSEGGSRATGARNADRLPAGRNWRIEPGSLAETRSAAVKARDNITAIETIKALDSEGRLASAEEQALIARYVGWGGLKNAFPDGEGNYGKGFEEIGPRLRELLSDAEYDTARRSIQYAHYTSETIVRSMWNLARQLGFKGGVVFEPGMGTGNFPGMMPADLAAATKYQGLEYDHLTSRIAHHLYPQWGVQQGDYTRLPGVKDLYDLVIGNPPFSETVISADPDYAGKGFVLHDYFFAKSLDSVRPGGLLMFVTSAGTMNKRTAAAREYMAERADLVGAIRLPGNAFEENAGTSVTTDIVVLRKRLPGEAKAGPAWTDTTMMKLPDREGNVVDAAVSQYFAAEPEMVLGEQGMFDKLVAGLRYAVRAPKGYDLAKGLRDAMARMPSDVMSAAPTATLGNMDFDLAHSERKDGSFYIGKDGRLMQMRGGAGRAVEKRGKGVQGGISQADQERITALIPIRDALRTVYAHDLAGNAAEGDKARALLNRHYDRFVQQFGPINKAELSYRRPTVIQQESARSAMREEERLAGREWDEGTFDPTDMIERGATLAEIARARSDARNFAKETGAPWREGTFDPEELPDIVIDKRPNVDAFMDDQEGYRLRAIEHYNDDSGEAKKGLVFFENVISRERAPTINSPQDALLYSMNKFGRPDMAVIADMSGVSVDDALKSLGDAVFEVPGREGLYQTREQYLSGDVRKKLARAQEEAKRDDRYARNVSALEAVQPVDLGPADIVANLGMPWLPAKDIEEFGKSLGLASLKVTYMPRLAQWTTGGDSYSAAATTTWGTPSRAAPDLISDALNRQTPKIYVEIQTAEGRKRVLDETATQAAQDKVSEIKQAFREWVWTDEARTARLVALYNRDYNNMVAPRYDGAYLTTPGIASTWSWRPHQTGVIARIIQSGNTYMAHEVGAGKTSAMIGAGMEMRRLGLVKKPMYVVPNHMLGQFTKEFYEQYPTARIAVADERRFHTDRRKQFIANVASDDLDAVIITHSAFGFIELSDEFTDGLIEQELDEYRSLLSEIPKDGDNRHTRRRIEQQIEQLDQRLSGRGKRKRDKVFTFEEMGADFLFVDEAHLFRKLDFATKMGSVKGIDPSGSKMSFDLFAKVRYLETRSPGRSVVLASGTPITNTMAELFSVSRYLQMPELEERGLTQFDAWAGAFGDTSTALEQDPAGGYKSVTRFSKFVNVPELSNMVRQVMDVVTGADLERYVTRPKLKGGKRQMTVVEQTPGQQRYQAALQARMAVIEKRKGPPQKGDDILLSVIGDGRKSAIDYRLIESDAPKEQSKLEHMIDNVERIWRETKRAPFHKITAEGYSAEPAEHGPAAQMIFADFGINGDFPVHKYIAAELARRGVPKSQIAIISDYKSHVAKQRLFNDMNEGKVRVLIGSVAKMGTGVNAQRRLYALHNMDAQWYPANDQQRNGRIIRQGNMNPVIEIHDYSTKGTYDSTMWGLMETKARFIEGFMRGDPSLRDMEDLGEASQYEQAKALTTSDPRIATLTEWRQELERMMRRRSAFDRELQAVRSRINTAQSLRAEALADIPQIEADIAKRTPFAGEEFSGKAGDQTFTDREEFGQALLNAMDEMAGKPNATTAPAEKIGEMGGFSLYADIFNGYEGPAARLFVRRTGNRETRVKDITNPRGLVTKIGNVLSGFENELENARSEAERNGRRIEEFTPQLDRSFDGMPKIRELQGQIAEMEATLGKESADAEARRKGEVKASIPEEDDYSNPPNIPASRAGEIAAINDEMRDRLRKLGLADRVKSSLMAAIPGYPSAAGIYSNGIIKVALDNRQAPVDTFNHEVIHALRDMGLFLPAEWRSLEAAAAADRTLMGSIRRRYPELDEGRQIEEAVADRYMKWVRGQKERGFIQQAFERVRAVLRVIGDVLRGNGFQNAESVMRAIEGGVIGARDGEVAAPSPAKASVPDSPAFDSAETEKRYQAAKEGLATATSLRERVGEFLETGWHGLTRHWIALPNVPKYSQLQQWLRRLEAAPQSAKERTIRMLEDLTKDFTPADMDIFTRKVILDDLSWDAANERELPFGFTPGSMAAERAKIDAILQADPDKKVWNAAMKRKVINRRIAQELVDAGVLEAERIKNPAYYRHQVLEYARAEQQRARSAAGMAKRLRTPKWAKRMGSVMDINANLIEAEFEWLAKAFTDIPVAETIEKIKRSEHNILEDLRTQAKESNKAGVDAALARAEEVLADNNSTIDELANAANMIDQEKRFRQMIAMGFDVVRQAIESNQLTVPARFETVADNIVIGRGSTNEPPFAFLSWILDSNEAGAMGAAMILKSIGQRRAWTQRLLGKSYIDPQNAEDLRSALAPEGYTTWQPDEGKLLFTVKTLPEHVIDRMIEKLDAPEGADPTEFRAALEQTRNLMAMGGDRYTMILPQEVADTLNQLRRVEVEGLYDFLIHKPMRAWKRWVLINPRRFLKYNINNISGDLDALIAGNPRALRRVGQAARELTAVMRGKAMPSARYQEAIDRGVFDSGLSVQEIPDINQFKAFERFAQTEQPLSKIAMMPLRKIWNALQTSTQWRENIFRYAAYLDYADRIESGQSVGYGASVPGMVDAITDTKDKAALLARDLIGDYGAISHFGAGLRRSVLPFWSWMEINTKRYWRLSANAYGQGIGKGIATGTLLGAAAGVRTTSWLVIRAAMVYGLIQLWNNLFFDDEEDELTDQQRDQLHIILGRSADGEIITLRTQGALSDAISWFGLGDTAAAFKEYEAGRADLWDVISAPFKAPINKVGTSLSPVLTVPIETATGKKLWPDLFNTRANRDPWRNLFSTLSLDNEYDSFMSLPSRGYGRSWQEAVLYRRDPGEMAYNAARTIAYDWLEHVKGQEGSSTMTTPRSEALRSYRTALRFKDEDAATAALEKMVELGMTKGDLAASIKRAAPLGPIAKKDRAAFISSLTDEEYETFQKAQGWYEETFTR